MFNNYQHKIDEANNQLKKWEDIKICNLNKQQYSMLATRLILKHIS